MTNKLKKRLTRKRERVEYAARLQGKIIKKTEKTNCVGALRNNRGDKNKAVKETKKASQLLLMSIGIELKSLILAQIERWRHA